MTRRIRAVIADDSPFVCRLIGSHLCASGDFAVVATVHDGDRVLEELHRHQPDVLTLDLDLPGRGGLEVLRQLMDERPTPTVVITGVSGAAAQRTMSAVEAGAVDFVLKYMPGGRTDAGDLAREIVQKVRAAVDVWPAPALPRASPERPSAVRGGTDCRAAEEVIVIGASTGGPLALRLMLGGLAPQLQAAVVVVQHIPASFTEVLASQLNRHAPLPVVVAADGDVLSRGTIRVAPGDEQLVVGSDRRLHSAGTPPGALHVPSIDQTMKSAASTYGPRTTGVLLTGMGADGAEGLRSISEHGGTTMVQDEESSTVYGMPARARELLSVYYVAAPRRLAELLVSRSEREHDTGASWLDEQTGARR